MSGVRKDEILAKKAKLLEMKRRRELRDIDDTPSRQRTGGDNELGSPTPSRGAQHKELDHFATNFPGQSRPGSAGPEVASPAARGSRPSSVTSAAQLSVEIAATPPAESNNTSHQPTTSTFTQTLSTTLHTLYDYAPAPAPEVLTYSKGIQTTEPWSHQRQGSWDRFSDSEDGNSPSVPRSPRKTKRLSRRERERDEELRQNLRKEIEEELKAVKDPTADGHRSQAEHQNFPGRLLTDEELKAVTASDEFLGFVERSSKVIERALDQEYDVLADYASGGLDGVDDDEEYGDGHARKGRRVREVAQFWDERWSKKRMISDISFSPKFSELVLASYTKNPTAPHDPDGLVQVWNLHLHDRPEYIFHALSDVLTAKFSPFHPNLIVGGAYSGQVLLWDTRAKSTPVQRTALTGSGHTHPVYSVAIVGTQNANNVISCSTDGVVCGWSIDMLSQPQEYLELTTPPPTKTEDLSPTCMAFPPADPTYFLVGTEEGPLYPCHRYARAGARAGVDQRLSYRGHAAPVMSVAFHPARGPVDLGDLVLTAGLDWTVKLWKIRGPATMSATAGAGAAPQVVAPLLDISREDVVYDAAWSPVKPGVFALVDGAGSLEVWDVTVDTEVPVAKVQPSRRKGAGMVPRSLNKVAWEEHAGKRVAVGGLDGVVSVFEVGAELGGQEGVRNEEWTGVKKLVGRLDAGVGGVKDISAR